MEEVLYTNPFLVLLKFHIYLGLKPNSGTQQSETRKDRYEKNANDFHIQVQKMSGRKSIPT